MQYRLLSLTAIAGLVQTALGSNYLLVDNYQGSNFFEKMDFFTGSDPTDGFVQYVDQSTAQNNGLISLSGNTVYMGVDHTNVASSSGRQSVRVSSTASYTHYLVTIDLAHMPGSICGVWPAFWSLGPNWPSNGEIDIIEGVNSQNTNFMTLHSSPNCAITGPGDGLLQPYTENCNTAVNGNAGCSFHETNTYSYGTTMNNNGGAQFAMEWTSEGVKIWWWNQHNPPPSDMFGGNPNPSNWGPPSANWAGGGCTWDSHFASHQLVFDTTFCGDWAGAVFSSDSQCSNLGSCNSYVQNNPSSFRNAYWSINDLKVYQNNGQNNDRRDTAETDEEKSNVDNVEAANAAEAHAEQEMQREAKRAAASQIAPSSVPTASRTVNPTSATAAAHSEAVRLGLVEPQPTNAHAQRDVIGESRRRRYMQA